MTDNEILKYAKEFRQGLVGDKKGDGLCFAVSLPLCGALNFLGINCRVAQFEVKGFDTYENHYAIAFDNGKILDPTYDQIQSKNDKIYLGYTPKNYIEI